MFEEEKHKVGETIKDKITHQPKSIESPNVVDIKSIAIEHPKTSHKLSSTIRQAEKVSHVGSGKSSNSHLYSETKKVKIF